MLHTASHEHTNKNTKHGALPGQFHRRQATMLLLHIIHGKGREGKERSRINTASSFCCDTPGRRAAKMEQVTFKVRPAEYRDRICAVAQCISETILRYSLSLPLSNDEINTNEWSFTYIPIRLHGVVFKIRNNLKQYSYYYRRCCLWSQYNVTCTHVLKQEALGFCSPSYLTYIF